MSLISRRTYCTRTQKSTHDRATQTNRAKRGVVKKKTSETSSRILSSSSHPGDNNHTHSVRSLCAAEVVVVGLYAIMRDQARPDGACSSYNKQFAAWELNLQTLLFTGKRAKCDLTRHKSISLKRLVFEI